MDIQGLTDFFRWCTLINGGILVLWTTFLMLAPDFVYQLQERLFSIPRATSELVLYGFLGLFKILFLVFNVTPLLALLIIG